MTTTIILLLIIIALIIALTHVIKRKPAIGFNTETGTMYRFKLSTHSKEYYAVFLNETEDGQARVCSPFNWRNRAQNADGTFVVDGAFTVDIDSLYK